MESKFYVLRTVEMSPLPENILLRYFDCWGRAQALRDFLHDQGIEFKDERIEKIEAVDGRWTQRQQSKPETLNSFRALPVLEWGEQRIEQTEAISLFLTLERGIIQHEDTQNLVRHASIFAFAHQDLVLPMALFLWTPVFHPEKDLEEVTEQNVQLIAGRAAAIESCVDTATGDFLFGKDPSVADCGLFAACRSAELLFGARFPAGSASVQAWKHRMFERLSAHPAWGQRPTDLSGSPVEDDLREQLPNLVRGYSG